MPENHVFHWLNALCADRKHIHFFKSTCWQFCTKIATDFIPSGCSLVISCLVFWVSTIGIWTSVVISPHKPIDHRSSAQSLYSITTPVPSKLSLTCVKNRHETLEVELSNLGTLTVLWLQDYLNPLFEFQSNFNLQIEFCREMPQQNRRFQHLFGQPWCIFFWIWYGQSVGVWQGISRNDMGVSGNEVPVITWSDLHLIFRQWPSPLMSHYYRIMNHYPIIIRLHRHCINILIGFFTPQEKLPLRQWLLSIRGNEERWRYWWSRFFGSPSHL